VFRAFALFQAEIKFNIIGHSHGTIYTREAITNIGLAPHVVSHTSLCGPHRGSVVADFIMEETPSVLRNALGSSLDFLYSLILGDDDPDSLDNGWDITRSHMTETFNPQTENIPGIYYQSWAAKAKISCPNILLEPSWLLILAMEDPGHRENDGLVSVYSANWGNFRGIEDAAWYSPGVDHFNMVGHFFGITPGFDAPEFFVDVVEDLKGRGF